MHETTQSNFWGINPSVVQSESIWAGINQIVLKLHAWVLKSSKNQYAKDLAITDDCINKSKKNEMCWIVAWQAEKNFPLVQEKSNIVLNAQQLHLVLSKQNSQISQLTIKPESIPESAPKKN